MPAPADNNNNNVVSEGWAAVGGHAAVIQQLKEMVLLPLQYPEVFRHMGITPPRGILFHGSPGIVHCGPVCPWGLRFADVSMFLVTRAVVFINILAANILGAPNQPKNLRQPAWD